MENTLATLDIVRANFLSPIVLAFALGIFAKLVRSELALPKDLYASLSIGLAHRLVEIDRLSGGFIC